MPEKITVDDSSYEQNLERAESLLRARAPWWSHRGAADPGITLIELWALLTDMQSYYMDQIRECHYRKYLKLLGEKPDEGGRAAAWVSMEGVERSMVLPRGTRLLADKMVFETDRANLLTSNSIAGFYLGEDPGNLADSLALTKKGSFRLRNIHETLFTLVFRDAVKKGELLELFFLLDEKNGRNPGWGEDPRLVRLVWEVWSGKGWRRAGVLRDETSGLLRSGKLILRVEEDMRGVEDRLLPEDGKPGFHLRCRVAEGGYDRLPTLYKVMLNVVRAVQQETLCESLYFPWNGEKRIYMHDYLGRTGSLEVYVRTEEGDWEDFSDGCAVSPPVESPEEKRFVEFFPDGSGRTPPEGDAALKIICRAPGFREAVPGWDVTGVSSQKITLPWPNVYRPSLRLQLKTSGDSAVYREYERAEPETCGERLFHWEDGENEIVLGDGRHGGVPEKAADGVCINELRLWEGEKGNTAYGRINRLERPELFGGISCCNYIAAGGGRSGASAQKQMEGLRGGWKTWGRAVTLEDYEQAARTAPGLIITDARAETDEAGRVIVTVETPAAEDEQAARRYHELLREHMDRFRMVTDVIMVRLEGEA